jgi:hypothetical protein
MPDNILYAFRQEALSRAGEATLGERSPLGMDEPPRPEALLRGVLASLGKFTTKGHEGRSLGAWGVFGGWGWG